MAAAVLHLIIVVFMESWTCIGTITVFLLHSGSTTVLQRVQNTAARLVFELRHHDHITSVMVVAYTLADLLPTLYLMHAVHTGRCPPYLANFVSLTSHRQTRSGLRSADSTIYTTPRLRTKFGERAFFYAGPAACNSLPADLRVWNALPPELRHDISFGLFRRKLKSHLFV